MKRKIIYGILLAVCLYIGLLYHYPQTRFLIAFVILLPLMCRLSLFFWRGRCRLKLEGGTEMIMKGETAEFIIRLENKSRLPISRVSVCLEYQEPGMERPCMQRFDRSMEGRGRLDIPVALEAEHCGPVDLKVSRLQIYDFIQLTCLTSKDLCRNQVLAAPPVHSVEIRAENVTSEGEVLPYYGNAENMEGYRIRQYQPGDHLHRVHWKLSAKADELQVKDFDRQAEGRVSLLLAARREQGEWDADRWDSYLETAASLMFSLYFSEETVLYRVMWIKEGGVLKAVDIREERDLQECLEGLLMLRPWEPEQAGETPDGGYGRECGEPDCLCLTMDLELFRGTEYLTSLAGAWEQDREGMSVAI